MTGIKAMASNTAAAERTPMKGPLIGEVVAVAFFRCQNNPSCSEHSA